MIELRTGRPTIALDGTETMEGRALFMLSALQWCTGWLPAVDLRMVDVTNEDVELAANVFSWEHGIPIDLRPPCEDDSMLEGVDLYAAAGFQSPGHLRLTESRHLGIPVLLAIQFPDPTWFSASIQLRRAAAFNPRVFAAELEQIVKTWL
jgi:hypothetical protein